ncbi:MAG: hypothetical protein ACTSU2_09205 [Promethearchaeota archaeon]
MGFFTRKGRSFLYLGIFLGILTFSLWQSKWSNSIPLDWREVNDANIYSVREGNGVPYLDSLGDINNDGINDYLIYDSFEKSMYYSVNTSYNDTSEFLDDESLINKSIDLVDSHNVYNSYGNSSMIMYSLNQANPKKILWKLELRTEDIMYVKVVSDYDGDGIKDIFVSLASVNTLPNLQKTGVSSYKELFKLKHEVFKQYFIVDIDRNKSALLISPNYTRFSFGLVSGGTGKFILRSDLESNLNFSNCVLKVIDMNGVNKTVQGNITDFNLLMLSTNLSLPRYYSPIFFKRSPHNYSLINWTQDIDDLLDNVEALNVSAYNYNWRIDFINLRTMEIKWTKSRITADKFGNDDIFKISGQGISYNELYGSSFSHFWFNTTLYDANWMDIYPFGRDAFIIKFNPVMSWFQGSELFLFPLYHFNVTFFSVYNITSGHIIWSGNINITYIMSPLDLDGDGLGQVDGYYYNNSELNIIYYNSSNGITVSRTALNKNDLPLIDDTNKNVTFITLSNDDKIGNDSVLEIIIVILNNSYYNVSKISEELKTPDPVVFGRLNLNMSYKPFLIKTNVFYPSLNVRAPENMHLEPLSLDIDGDNWNDLMLYQKNNSLNRVNEPNSASTSTSDINASVILSGAGIKLQPRMLKSIFSWYIMPDPQNDFEIFDHRGLNNTIIFFKMNNPNNGKTSIAAFSISDTELVFVSDVNVFLVKVPFIDFFNEGKQLLFILISMIIFSIIGAIWGSLSDIRRKSKVRDLIELNPRHFKEISKLKKIEYACTIIMLGIVVLTIYFFTVSIDLTIGYTPVAISSEGQLIWFIMFYPGIFAMIVIISELYSRSSPYLANKLFIEPQRKMFKLLFEKTKRKRYDVMVINMRERNTVSIVARINRMILPLLIAFTVGVFVYQGLAEDGAIFKALYPTIIDRPLTNPNALGVINADVFNPKVLWIEIGKFARYGVMPMLITYILEVFFIPGAWLLDDAGVCFYQEALHSREVSDVDSVSKFFLNLISGLFGFTAIVGFIQLFIPMLTNIDDLIYFLRKLSNQPPIFGASVLILALIVFPILAGIILVIAAQRRMEEDLDYNTYKLYKIMERAGIDTTPRDLSVILSDKAKLEPLFKVKPDGPEKNKKIDHSNADKKGLKDTRKGD